MAPLVNILIANYNYGEWIGSCIKSAISQSYSNIMITVVDSASTDNSWDIITSFYDTPPLQSTIGDALVLQGYIDKIPYICIKLNEAKGPSFARNVGIDLTLEHTDIYAILDADDEYFPTKVSRCVAELSQTSIIGAVYTDYITLNTMTGEKAYEYKEPFSRKRLLQSCIVHSGALISKKALIESKDEFGYYDNNMRTCEDYDLWVRISEKYMITHIPEAHSLVRIQPKNSTLTVDNSVWQQNWARIGQKINLRGNK